MKTLVFCLLAASAAHATAPTPAEMKKAAACRRVVVGAQKLGILSRLTVDVPLIVVVGPKFQELSFESREQLAANINCFVMLGTDNVINFDLLDYRTHAVVGRFKYGKLQPE